MRVSIDTNLISSKLPVQTKEKLMFEKQLKEFFFTAMLGGYAGNSESSEIPGMPGYKAIRYEEGELLLVDAYCTTPRSIRSSGTTTIFLSGNPIWWMTYYGEYEKVAIPFLKKVLSETYKNRSFCGGRGPSGFLYEGDFKYHNTLKRNDFADFAGAESICDRDNNPLGWHKFHGFSLV